MNEISQRQKQYEIKEGQFPGGQTMERWKKSLGLALTDVIRKTFQATTEMVTSRLKIDKLDEDISTLDFLRWKKRE